MNRYAIATPPGTADRLFSNCTRLRVAEQRVCQVLEQRGYQEAMTPSLEYYDVFLQAASPLRQEDMFKLVDDSGRLLVLRPDSTTPLARVAATKLTGSTLPLRLFYRQTVFRAHAGNGHPQEIQQAGAELIGAGGVLADLDILTAACAVLEQAGIQEYCIELGHAGIYQRMIAQLNAGEEKSEEIRNLIESKSFAALGDELKPFSDHPAYPALKALPMLFGDGKVLAEARELTDDPQIGACLDYLDTLYQALSKAGYGAHITIDLGLVHEMSYYTGVLFRGYRSEAGGTVLTGGRYDRLCSHFGRDLPAVGFAVDLDGLVGILPKKPQATTLLYATPNTFWRAVQQLQKSHGEADLFYGTSLSDAKAQAQAGGYRWLVDCSQESVVSWEVSL